MSVRNMCRVAVAILPKFASTTLGVAWSRSAPITQRCRDMREKSSLSTRDLPYQSTCSPSSFW